MSKLEKGYGSRGIQAVLGDMKTYYEGELAKKANTSDIPDITGKADKVTNATSGHLAGLDSNGNLTDSGVSPTEEVTVEGNPVTFDSPFEQDAKSVVVSVKPIQDLHGYDHPWVGGAGKNKFATSFTQKNIQYIECNEFVVPAEEYVFKFKNISSSAIAFWASDSSDITDTTIHIVNAGQTANVTYTVGSGGKVKFEMRYNPSEEGITPSSISEVALYLSNDVPASYEPYENICPISGIDEVEIEVSDGESEPTTTTIPLPSTLYGGTVRVDEGDADDTHGLAEFDGSSDEGWQIASDTTAWFYINLSNVSFSGGLNAVMSNLFKSDFSDSPWNIEDNAWIRYGQLHVRPNSVISPSGQTAEGLAEFKAWLANNPLQVCYELATPTTISFDPTDVELLEGTNVVSTNAEKVAVTYKAGILATLGDIDDLNDKVKTKFDKKDVAKVEGANASKPYAVGDYMLRSDGFYVVTQAIAQNAPITSNNTDKTTVGNELSSKVDTDDSRLSDARTPVAHTHNISDITGIPAWMKLGEVTGTSPDYANSSTFNLSALQNKDVLMIFSADEGTLTAKQGIITLEYSAFEFGKILEDSVQEEDEITRLWKGFYGGAPRESVATFEEFLRGLGYVYIATHSTTAEIGAKIYGAYDWTLEIYTK